MFLGGTQLLYMKDGKKRTEIKNIDQITFSSSWCCFAGVFPASHKPLGEGRSKGSYENKFSPQVCFKYRRERDKDKDPRETHR